MWTLLKSKLSLGLLLNPWVWTAVASALAASHTWVYMAGSASAHAELSAQITTQALATAKASEDARIKEHALQTKATKVTNDYLAEKNKRVADGVHAGNVLREYREALARVTAKDTSAPSGIVDAIAATARECSGAFAEMDKAARQYRGVAAALQDYTREVCVAP